MSMQIARRPWPQTEKVRYAVGSEAGGDVDWRKGGIVDCVCG